MKNLTDFFQNYDLEQVADLKKSIDYAFTSIDSIQAPETLAPLAMFNSYISDAIAELITDSKFSLLPGVAKKLKKEIAEAYQIGLAEADKEYFLEELTTKIFNGISLYFEKKSLKASRSLSISDIREIFFDNVKTEKNKAIKRKKKDYTDFFKIEKINKNNFSFTPLV